jgi:tyrosyl-tRNA synthetase
MDVHGELTWRGLVYDATEGLRDEVSARAVTVYCGFDPTAASLHVGSLVPIMGLAHFQRAGHAPIALVGGGTGLIGDPSGKNAERDLLTAEQVASNVAGVRAQLSRFLDFDAGPRQARLVDNAEWLTAFGAIAFMRDVGKHFTVNYMQAKESVKRRLGGGEGISYTEFSYLLLQAYDFLELYDRFGCTVQIGGSDQWGNITAGMDLIRRARAVRAHGLVLPLVTTASGVKFGKTEAGTIWLDPALTSPFEFYQFWFNVDDRDVVGYLKYFTFLERGQIEELAAQPPEQRTAQRELAREMTARLHGQAAVRDAEAAAEKLFSGDLRAMSESELLQVFCSSPSLETAWLHDDWPVRDFLAAIGITASKGEATRLIKGGGLYVNDERVTDEKQVLTLTQALLGGFFIVRKGKKDVFLVRIQRN